MKIAMTKIAFALFMAVAATGAQAADQTFSFTGGGAAVNGGTAAPTGSWFSMLAGDLSGGGDFGDEPDGIPDTNIYTSMRGVSTTNGTLNFDITNTITLGTAPTPPATTATHNSGNMIDRDWNFFGQWGAHYTQGPLEIVWDGVSTTATVDMAGWTVAWNAGSIDMGAGALAVLSMGANNVWGGGDDTLDYSAVVPSGGFTGVAYSLHLVGSANNIAAVPEASTYGMMLAGLGLVGFAVRRRKLVA